MDLRQRLDRFRAAHAPRRVRHAGTEWRYLVGGDGPATVLVLGGALGIAEFGFSLIEALESGFRVIAPDYPPLGRVDGLVDGLVAILDHEGVAAAQVHGASFGGLLAQALLRRAPGRVGSLVLSHTAPPSGSDGAAALVPAIVAALPAGIIRALLLRRLGGVLRDADPFYRTVFIEGLERLGKRDLVARLEAGAEIAARRFAPGDPEGWRGRVLVIEADDDPMIAASGREALRALYPGAERHLFHGTGHLAAILRPEEYNAVVARFLRDAARSAGEE
jgi:pimeloyl-ACP methyl ester carboxylesterase